MGGVNFILLMFVGGGVLGRERRESGMNWLNWGIKERFCLGVGFVYN